ncbi:hypothetical protein DNHGIG_29460 [Collibacillus ludicampi]|uniref:DUF502 domain-containing protein n=1 Tax=Collibacillus ludicampi TaxID=2771369 RepID=A0AAV4LJ32_9BACL|nr:DUF502 domain-containing protein [Collibacillus ludicampi]GIM47397.1 hypothetical protein DNHGIG_29460 [Collibacillus ludicampi]
MKRLVKYFVNGIITIVPIGLVIYVIVQVFQFLDNLLGRFLRQEMKSYIPGLGLLLSIILITCIGILATNYVSRRIFDLADQILKKIPFVKSLYAIVKETIESLIGKKRSFSQVALITIPGTSMKMVGFLTSDDAGALTDSLSGYVTVYVPQSFQMAGLTLLVPREDVELLPITAEEAMRFILSAGVAGYRKESVSTD